jgi:aryl-alcohol dehydrogenase-like predicted oxidoreductase
VSLDAYVTLGRSGLRVSPFTLGTMTFGEDWGWGASPDESKKILADYVDRGGNSIDTANLYTNGHSEQIIGDFLAGQPALRDRLVLATKFFGNLYENDPNGGGPSRKAIVQQLENSLRRLQTDYIDMYWLHNFDPATPIEETLRALDDLVSAGKIRYVGFSDVPAWATAEAATIARLEYSLLERTSEGELIPMARAMGMGVMPWSPLRGGFLSGKYSSANKTEVDTARGLPMIANMDPATEPMKSILAAHPVGRVAQAAEIADAVVWLSSDKAGFITGVALPIDGGYTVP